MWTAQAAVAHAAGCCLALALNLRTQLVTMLACTRVIRMSAAKVIGSAGLHRNHFVDVKTKNSSLKARKHPSFLLKSRFSFPWLRFILLLSFKWIIRLQTSFVVYPFSIYRRTGFCTNSGDKVFAIPDRCPYTLVDDHDNGLEVLHVEMVAL